FFDGRVEVFLGVVTHSQMVGELAPREHVHRVLATRFYSVSTSQYDNIYDFYSNPADTSAPTEQLRHPCEGVAKYLSSGAFYYSSNFDITKNAPCRWVPEQRYMLTVDVSARLVLIQGYVGIQEYRVGSETLKVALISRMGCKRAGVRFQTRGLDDDGNVANYVETETLFLEKHSIKSYLQVRGNVPAFWEQQGLQLKSHKVQLARTFDATKAALQKHLDRDLAKFSQMQIVNLLSETEPGESALSDTFQTYLAQLGYENITLKHFDFNNICRNGNLQNAELLVRQLEHSIRKFGYYTYDVNAQQMTTRQQGVFRTNCMDCLDRTNVMQSLISTRVLKSIIQDTPQWGPRHWEILGRHNEQWAENGDALSRVYTGTNALKSSFTRKGKSTLAGLLSDASKSLNRMYNSAFKDEQKQENIDMLLGRLVYQKRIAIYDPVNDKIQSELKSHESEFRKSESITIWTGTYNVNGRSPSASIKPWINVDSEQPGNLPELFVIGFEEVVELTAQQIMSTDVAKRQEWEELALYEINTQLPSSEAYISLRSGQLVGVALAVFVRRSSVNKIRQVEMAMKKTGLGGVSGNKGALAIRLHYLDTGFCFVCGHFASGQSNYQDRNNDYHTIMTNVTFTNGRRIEDHKQDVRRLAYEDNFEPLLRADQLRQCMAHGEVFRGFSEGYITFPPTYKYDLGSDQYDTSEKARIPAWTDRILYKGKSLELLEYSHANLRISDHRPGKCAALVYYMEYC
ncbi:Endonuclease/exonuclease/phosphatase, partial [Thamnocephalis sphaerospora]